MGNLKTRLGFRRHGFKFRSPEIRTLHTTTNNKLHFWPLNKVFEIWVNVVEVSLCKLLRCTAFICRFYIRGPFISNVKPILFYFVMNNRLVIQYLLFGKTLFLNFSISNLLFTACVLYTALVMVWFCILLSTKFFPFVQRIHFGKPHSTIWDSTYLFFVCCFLAYFFCLLSVGKMFYKILPFSKNKNFLAFICVGTTERSISEEKWIPVEFVVDTMKSR